MIKISLIPFLVFSLIPLTLNAQDPGSPDTIYFKASGSYSDDTIFVPQTDPPWDIYVDVMVRTDNGVAGVSIPLKDTCYDDLTMPTYLDPMKNDPDSVTPNAYTGTAVENFGIISLNLYGTSTPTPPNFLVGAVDLTDFFGVDGVMTQYFLAHLTFTVNELGCICLDTISAFQPGGATPGLTTRSPVTYVPQFQAKCFVISQWVDVPEEEKSSHPEKFQLFPNYPNPFNPITTIPFTVHSKQKTVNRPIPTTLVIYNILGQKVRTLVDEPKKPGEYEVVWDGKDEEGNQLSSGVYFYKLKTKDFVQSKKMLLIR